MHEEQSPLILQRHVCEICGKSFKVKSNLKEHIRSHSDARTFLCGFCGKALKNRQCLNRHLFTHGVKYTCHVCGKNFANPSSLNVHKRDRHGLNVWKHLLYHYILGAWLLIGKGFTLNQTHCKHEEFTITFLCHVVNEIKHMIDIHPTPNLVLMIE